MGERLVWLWTDSATGQRQNFESAQTLVQAAMARCRRDGTRWPVRRG